MIQSREISEIAPVSDPKPQFHAILLGGANLTPGWNTNSDSQKGTDSQAQRSRLDNTAVGPALTFLLAWIRKGLDQPPPSRPL
jgi:hypothetical protein